MAEHLRFKWGSLKAWNVESDAAWEAFDRWAAGGVCMSAAMHRDTAEQKRALCDLIDAIDGEIENAWTDKPMTKDEAKKYVMEYDGGRTRAEGN